MINNPIHNHNIDNINALLSYNNTNKTLIVKCLDYLWKMKNTPKFFNLLNISKFCITKELNIKNNDKINSIDLSKEFNLVGDIFSFINDK